MSDCKCEWVANSGNGGELDYRKQWKEHWHGRYMARMMERAALTEPQAKEALDAGMDDFDYSDTPEDAADMEMSYWGD